MENILGNTDLDQLYS